MCYKDHTTEELSCHDLFASPNQSFLGNRRQAGCDERDRYRPAQRVSASTLSRIENSTGTPDAETLAKLSKWLNLSLDRIIGLQAVLENSVAQFMEGSTPDMVEAHLRADSNLTPENALALSELFRLAYKQYSVKK